MIVEIFLVLLILAIFCMVYGNSTNELSWTAVGCAIFFILSAQIVFGNYVGVGDPRGLEYKTGVNITVVSGTNTVVTNIYSSYNDVTTFWIGLFLSVIAGLGIILIGIKPQRKVK